jgi:hypothetical protein
MSFRRAGKNEHAATQSWRAWLERYAEMLRDAGLPPSILESPAEWEYLLRYGYHCDGAYPNIDFRLDELSEAQRAAFKRLLEVALTAEEKQRGSAGWHFVCPPSAVE